MSFHNDRTPGEMIERIDGDVADLAIFFATFVIRIVGSLLLPAGVLIVLLWEDWRISLALAVYAGLALVLLFRLYDPDAGRISLGLDGDRLDLREARLADLHHRVGIVTQEVQLFRATVRDNLTFFDRGIADERIRRAIEDLELDPHTDDTPTADTPTWKLLWALIRFEGVRYIFNNIAMFALTLGDLVPGLVGRESLRRGSFTVIKGDCKSGTCGSPGRSRARSRPSNGRLIPPPSR